MTDKNKIYKVGTSTSIYNQKSSYNNFLTDLGDTDIKNLLKNGRCLDQLMFWYSSGTTQKFIVVQGG